ncbi:MAG: type II secretion system F family protein [Actinomycetota bacterium]
MMTLLALGCAAAAGFLVPQGGRHLSRIGRPVRDDSDWPAGLPWTGGSRTARESQSARAAPGQIRAAELPLALDLIAVCLSGGATPADALSHVGAACSGALAAHLSVVARALQLGSSARQAWGTVADGSLPSMQRAAESFVHAERSGAALAPRLVALAADERQLLQLARARSARRVGVLAAAPLGICFLPAFILVGVLPVVAGLLSRLSL